MNSKQMDELKQVLFASVTEAVDHGLRSSDLVTKADLKSTEQRLETRLEKRLGQRLDTMQAAIVETITLVNDAHDQHFNEHDARLRVLEKFAGVRA